MDVTRIPLTPDETITLGRDLFSAKLYYVCACTLLAYDYLLTFSREVEEIWKKKKGVVFCLFITNRYVSISFCVITLFAYFSPLWTFEICNRYAMVEWIETLLIVIPAEIILSYRVFALTNRNLFIVGVHACTILGHIALACYAMSLPGLNKALPIPNYSMEPFHICTLFSDPQRDAVCIAFLTLAIFFDASVFTITLLTTIRGNRLVPRTVLLRTMQRDGALYFCSILTGNILWMVLALRARPGLKLLNALPSMVITSVMISRLTLSLRRASGKGISLVPSSLGWSTDSNSGSIEIAA